MHPIAPPSTHPQSTPHNPPTAPSPLTAFVVLMVQSFQRHWRVRQMGWVSVGLLAAVVAGVTTVTVRDLWGLPTRPVDRSTPKDPNRRPSQRQFAEQVVGATHPLSPLAQGIAFAVVAPQQAVVVPAVSEGPPRTEAFAFSDFLHSWKFMNFSRWVVLGVFLGFVLPLFTLAYASAAFGTERESRSLVWVMTRPIPRSAIYLAKFLGTLPWCVAFGVGGFVILCLAGGELGRRALEIYWPAAVAGTVAFSALFHFIGAIFRRPVIVGVVYVFFFEIVIGLLPGSLKLLSLAFYTRCLMYNAATAAGYPAGMLNLLEVEPAATAWAVLGAATLGVTALGMWLFARLDYRDDV